MATRFLSKKIILKLNILSSIPFLITLMIGMTLMVQAATFTPGCPGPTNIANGNALRAAIATANSNNQDDTIHLTTGCTYDVSGGIGTLSVQNDSHHSLIITGNRSFISGNHLVSVLDVGSGATVTISDVAILNGYSSQNPGGGISNSGTLTLNNSAVRYNVSGQDGGGIRNSGTIYLTDVVVSGNQGTFGGGISATGPAFLSRVSIGGINTGDGNTGGGLHLSGADLQLTDVAIVGNSGDSTGAGLNITAGGLVTLTNVTIANNTTTASGGGLSVNNNSTDVTLTNVTVSGNTAGTGGGIYCYNNSDVKLRNTILTYNFGGNCTIGTLSTITNEGNNLENGSGCGWGTEKGSLSNVAPRMRNLTGSPAYFPLLPDSPAIDLVIYNAPNGCPAADIRGAKRPQGPLCDSGAYEFVPTIYLPVISK